MAKSKTKTKAKTKNKSEAKSKPRGKAKPTARVKITRGEDKLALASGDDLERDETSAPSAQTVDAVNAVDAVDAADAADAADAMHADGDLDFDDDDAAPSTDDDDAVPSTDGDDGNAANLRTRYLKCELTISEIQELRAGREAQDEKVEELEAEHLKLTAKAKDLKERIQGLIAEGRATSRKIRDGFEYRDVACFEKEGVDPRPGETHGREGMVTIRIDTKEVIDWRELSARERQGSLFTESSGNSSGNSSKTGNSKSSSGSKTLNGKSLRNDFGLTGSPA